MSLKFERQINQLSIQAENIEENQQLQERVKKAATYFLEKLENQVISPLRSAGYQTDNAAVRKSFREGIEKLQRELFIKKSLLSSATNGFSMKNYLDTKAKSSIATGFDTNHTEDAAFVSSSNPDFFRIISAWRSKKAKKQQVTNSKIIQQKTLNEIAETLPATSQQLKAIKGMGGKKMQQYGREILEMIISYRNRITSYNVCYTKLLRQTAFFRHVAGTDLVDQIGRYSYGILV